MRLKQTDGAVLRFRETVNRTGAWGAMAPQFAKRKLQHASLNDRDGEAVITLGADGLDGRAVQPRVLADEGKRRAGAFDIGVAAVLVEHGAVAYDVVADDDS